MSSPANGPRLESWKEIAAYLGKTVRTIQRWEAEGFPVHRELHRSRGYVFAYPAEIDAWLEARRLKSRPVEPTVSAEDRGRTGLRWRAVGAAIVLLVAAGLLVASRPQPRRDPVWILVASTDNRVGDPDLDAVSLLLAREVGQTRNVYIVPPDRVQDALRLMGKDLATRLDEPLAREICLRDGGIGFVVTSRVERAGNSYSIWAGLGESQSGKLRAGSIEVAAVSGQVPGAVRRLASTLRRAVGDRDAVTPAVWERLQRVTTPSLSALRLYSEAFRLLPGAESEKLARAALEQDPDFASARLWLAWCIWNQRPADPEWRIHVQRAIALSSAATDRERQFILASRLSMEERFEEAAVGYRRLLANYPDEFWARNNLRVALNRLGRRREAASEIMMLSDLRPDNLELARHAFWEAIHISDRFALAKFSRRLHSIEVAAPEGIDPRDGWIDRMSRLHEWWVDGKLEEVAKELDRIAGSPDISSTDGITCAAVVAWNQSLGRFHAAERALAGCGPSDYRATMRAVTDYYRDDPAAVEAAVRDAEHETFAPYTGRFFDLAVLAAGPGWDMARVRRMAYPKLEGIEQNLLLLEARFAALQGGIEKANRCLQQSESLWAKSMRAPVVVQCVLARAQELAGRNADALRTLEAADIGPVSFYVYPGTSTIGNWHRIRYERARLLRKLGRGGEALEIENSLRRELRLADAGHPLLTRLAGSGRPPLSVY